MKIVYIIITILIVCNCKVNYSVKPQPECNKYYDLKLKMDVYSNVDEMPQYPGGLMELLKFVAINLKYPEQEVYQGTIIYSFVVDRHGRLIDTRIYNKKKEDYTPLDKEAIRVLELMPRWTVGKCNGIQVPVRVILPIKL